MRRIMMPTSPVFQPLVTNYSKSLLTLLLTTAIIAPRIAGAEPLRAGVARIDITDPQAGRVNDPCFAKALVLRQGDGRRCW